MHKQLRLELPGKVLPLLPRKNKTHSYTGKEDDDADSIDSFSNQDTGAVESSGDAGSGGFCAYLSSWTPGHARSRSRNASRTSISAADNSLRASVDRLVRDTPPMSPTRDASPAAPQTVLFREEQRVSLRAFLRTFLQNEAIANSIAMHEFTAKPTKLTAEELEDIDPRKVINEKRLEQQRRFFEVARERAKELDVYIKKLRRKVIKKNGLRDLFAEIKRKDKIEDLDPEYRKFAK
jgi:hypothetical protein